MNAKHLLAAGIMFSASGCAGDLELGTIGADPATTRVGVPVDFTCEFTGGSEPLSYLWNFGDGAMSGLPNTAHTYNVAGRFTATCGVVDADGNIAASSVDVHVTAASPLEATINAEPSAGSAPLTVSFAATAVGGTAPMTYAWDFGDDTTSTEAAPTHVYSTSGPYVARVEITDAEGNSAEASTPISVYDNAPVIDSITVANGWPGTTSTCAVVDQTELLLTAVAHDDNVPAQRLSYEWSLQVVPVGSLATLSRDTTEWTTFTPDLVGDYIIEVTVSNESGQAAVDGVTITAETMSSLALVSPETLPDGEAGEAYEELLVVQASTDCGLPVAGVFVDWGATANGLVVSADFLTDESGLASADVIIGCSTLEQAVVQTWAPETTPFRKHDYTTEEDCIEADVCITRGNAGDVFDANEEGDNTVEWACGPCNDIQGPWRGTLKDLRNDGCFSGPDGNRMRYVPGEITCLRILATDSLWNIAWSDWTSNRQGGGFAYNRSKLTRPDDPDYAGTVPIPTNIDVVTGTPVAAFIEAEREVPVVDGSDTPVPMDVTLTIADSCGNPVTADDIPFEISVDSGDACFDDLCGTANGVTTKTGLSTTGGTATVQAYSHTAEWVGFTATAPIGYSARGWAVSGPSAGHVENPVMIMSGTTPEGGTSIWEWGRPSVATRAGSGTRVLATDLDGNYQAPTEATADWLWGSVPVACDPLSKKIIRFWEYHDIGAGAVAYVSVNDPLGPPLTPVLAAYDTTVDGHPGYQGTSTGWREVVFDLTPYTCQTVELYWTLYVTPGATAGYGWAIDDLTLESTAGYGHGLFLGGPTVFSGSIASVQSGVAGCTTSPAVVELAAADEWTNDVYYADATVTVTSTGTVQFIDAAPGVLVSQTPPSATVRFTRLGSTDLMLVTDTAETVTVTLSNESGDLAFIDNLEMVAAAANETGLCDDGLDNDCDGDTDCDDSDCEAQWFCCPEGEEFLFTATSIEGPVENLGILPALVDYPYAAIQITKVGICGDSDDGSGPNQFEALGDGLDLTWEAGQSTVGGTNNYPLGSTPDLGGSARGFIYSGDISAAATAGSDVLIRWTYHEDWDGLHCEGMDELDNTYSDPPNTVRAWVRYEYVCNPPPP